MLNQVSKQEHERLMEEYSAMRNLRKLLDGSLESIKQDAMTLESPYLQWHQGAAQVLTELRDLLTNPRSGLDE